MKREISKLAAAAGLVLGMLIVAQPAMADNSPPDYDNSGIEELLKDIVNPLVDIVNDLGGLIRR